MRIIVAGDRRLTDYDLVRRELDRLLAECPDVEIVQGGAEGADALAKRYAKERGLPLLEFPADWNQHGRAAGPIRNRQMIIEGKGEVLIAFDGGGPGTRSMIGLARRHGLPVFLVPVASPR